MSTVPLPPHLDWEVPAQIFQGRAQTQGDIAMSIAIAITTEALRLVNEQTPDLEQLIHIHPAFHFQAHYESDWFGLRLIYHRGVTAMFGPRMEPDDIVTLKARVEPFVVRTPQQLHHILGSDWFDFNKFTYVGPYKSSHVSWSNISDHLLAWLNTAVLPRALALNATRIQRVVQPSKSFDIVDLSKALWVLECEETMKQGTAFSLSGLGLITCDHVLGTNTFAFRFDNPDIKWKIRIVARNAAIDLAILELEHPLSFSLSSGNPSSLAQMDQILVLGHPNYRLGDSPFATPGLVVGFRQRLGIRRIMTNAAIVAGSSGAPVFDSSSQVIGVAATGSDRFDKIYETEDISIIPIDALGLLMK